MPTKSILSIKRLNTSSKTGRYRGFRGSEALMHLAEIGSDMANFIMAHQDRSKLQYTHTHTHTHFSSLSWSKELR